MNERQRRFADEYIISRNATQSAIKVGYSEKTAYSIGQRLLKNVEISEYIKKRTEELFDERSMSIAEALAISASIARGETQQGYSKKTVKTAKGVEVSETTYEFYVTFSPSRSVRCETKQPPAMRVRVEGYTQKTPNAIQ